MVAIRRANFSAAYPLGVLLSIAILYLSLAGCKQGPRQRPFGEIRLGNFQDFSASETFLKDKRLLIRHDAGGLSVMSTECTYDLAPLYRKAQPDGSTVFISHFSDSQYSNDGKVIHGPATFDLPFYEIFLSSGKIGGPPDTVYVKMGVEVPRELRLKVPPPGWGAQSQVSPAPPVTPAVNPAVALTASPVAIVTLPIQP